MTGSVNTLLDVNLTRLTWEGWNEEQRVNFSSSLNGGRKNNTYR